MPQAPATRQSIVELPFSLFISQCLCVPPGLGDWFAPSVFLAMLGLQGKRIGELRADMHEGGLRPVQG